MRLHLYEISRVVKITETENGLVAARAWEEENGEGVNASLGSGS